MRPHRHSECQLARRVELQSHDGIDERRGASAGPGELEDRETSFVGTTSYVNEVWTAKLPPAPPRTAQKRSGFSVSEAVTMSPLAVTTWVERRISQVIPTQKRHNRPLPAPFSIVVPLLEKGRRHAP